MLLAGAGIHEGALGQHPQIEAVGGAGDLMCRVVVETPVQLDKRQRELLEEFRGTLQGNSSHSPKASGWFEGMKRFFDDL